MHNAGTVVHDYTGVMPAATTTLDRELAALRAALHSLEPPVRTVDQ
nr:hypothetical protein [Mycobacterium leprae]